GGAPGARLPARASGRTAFDLAGRLPEGQPRADAESALVWSMEGAQGLEVPPALRTRADRPGLHSASSAWLGTEGVGGPVRGGDPGVHLFAEGGSGAIHAGRGTPLEDLPGEGFRLLPLHDPFSASSADRASPPLAERASAPRLLLHPEDAAALGAAEGARLLIDGTAAPAPLSLDPSVPRGHLALSGARSHARFVTLEVAR
ncbi:NADH-quinone oxidoreductase subunit NuoG, partial [Rhodobacter sphaeroides]|nr:NADH-quinone oxidoreductase subunit NuoG [Cereibacter sphaeroides]